MFRVLALQQELREMREHLQPPGVRSGALAAWRALVETPTWAQAWEALEGGVGGYLSDVEGVWQRAIAANRQVAASNARPLWLGLEVR